MYERFWCSKFHPRQGDVVFDIGSGQAEDLEVFSAAVGQTGRVVAFECNPAFEEANRSAAYVLGNVVFYKAAVSDEPGVVVLEGADNWESRTTCKMTHGHRLDLSANKAVMVPAVRLDSIVADLHLERIDLLKMNIEGAEVQALQGLGAAVSKVQHAVIGAHDFRAHRGEGEQYRTHSAVVQYLQANGFKTETTPGWWHVHAWR